MDIITLYSVVSVVAAGGAGLVWYFSRQRPDAAGARAWAAGLGCLALYFAAAILREQITTFVSFTVGNAVAIVGLGLMHQGACQITRRRCPFWVHGALAIVVAAAILAFWQDPETGYRARVVVVGTATAWQSGAIAWTLWQPTSGAAATEFYARRLSVSVFLTLAALQCLRVWLHLPFLPTAETSFLADTTMTRVSAATFLTICLALPFLVVFMNEARARHELRRTIGELQHALDEVKTLRGLIPICSSCQRVRDTGQQWRSIERYLNDHTDAQLSHGVCPDCMRTLYPEFADEILNEPKG